MHRHIAILTILTTTALAQSPEPGGLPAVAPDLAAIASQFTEYDVIVEPPVNEPEWWAGTPSVCRKSAGHFSSAMTP